MNVIPTPGRVLSLPHKTSKFQVVASRARDNLSVANSKKVPLQAYFARLTG